MGEQISNKHLAKEVRTKNDSNLSVCVEVFLLLKLRDIPADDKQYTS